MTSLSPRPVITLALLASLALLTPLAAQAQSGGEPQAPPAKAAPQAKPDVKTDEPDPDLQVVLGEPDFTIAALPTTLRMPRGKFDFRMTHRFSLPINSGTTGDFFKNFFNFDSSAQIGFELRYGLMPGTQVAFYRTNERTIQFLGQRQVVQQGDTGFLSADVIVAVEGRENFSERFATTIGGVLAHRVGKYASFYVEPMVTLNANTAPGLPGDPRNTGMVGIGGRVRLGASRTYLVGEFAPRVGNGYVTGVDHMSFGIEKRAGGHVFQLNVSNNIGTSLAQIARGGFKSGTWFIGFNLTRKFF